MEFREFKNAAKTACEYLSHANISVPHNRMLEALSHGFFGRGWSSYRDALTKGRGVAPAPTAEEVAGQVASVVKELLDVMEMQERRERGEFHMTARAAFAFWSAAKQKGEQLRHVLQQVSGPQSSVSDVHSAPWDESAAPIADVIVGRYHVRAESGEEASATAVLRLTDGHVSLVMPTTFEPGVVQGPVSERWFSFEDIDEDDFRLSLDNRGTGLLFVPRERLQFVRAVMTPR